MGLKLSCLSIEQLAPLLEKQEVSPVEVAQSVVAQTMEAAERSEASVCSYQTSLLTAAKQAEREIGLGQYRGPLHGIPMDVRLVHHCSALVEASSHSSSIRVMKSGTPDALTVTMLQSAGAVCADMSPASQATAVKNGITIASTSKGTVADDAIVEIARYGLIDFRPTHVGLSQPGERSLAGVLNDLRFTTRTVWDAAVLLSGLVDSDVRQSAGFALHSSLSTSFGLHLHGLTIGVEEDYFFGQVDEPVASRVRAAIRRLEALGANVRPVSIPMLSSGALTDCAAALSGAGVGGQRALREEAPSVVQYVQAQQARSRLRAQMNRAFGSVDVLVAPSLTVHPSDVKSAVEGDVRGGAQAWLHQLQPAKWTGFPSLHVPYARRDGASVSVQLIGPAFREGLLLKVGYALEKSRSQAGADEAVEMQTA
ncbi:amidase family protein [Alicyclobacillus suci]|uniref:amidase family protein n=1 Tax=Alicyclobacillus suci TaxID=2816080 RepID=UPI001A8D85AF|nr:amidase family protein [Alicyclobacillus suci]